MKMRLGILETGRPAAALAAECTSYADLFKTLLSPVAPQISYEIFAVLDGKFPSSASVCDAWLITGSPTGVLDDEPWIDPLKDFLAAAFTQGIPIVGICFGHQVLAAALGGRVECSAKGWGIGVNDYPVLKSAPWMQNPGNNFAIQALHQDQVVALAPDTEVLAGSDFCPYALLAYGTTAISFQGHPEIPASLARSIIQLRRGTRIPVVAADRALQSVDRPDDAREVAGWIARFLEQAMPRRLGSKAG